MSNNGENNPNYKHGGTTEHRKTYNSWRAMKWRCNNPNYRAYDRYGGRGITYCDRWESFSNFLEDMGDRPDGCTLDRIDNNCGYYKENCRWADQTAQMNNSSKVLGAKVTKSMLENAKCSSSVVYKRIKEGWSVDDAINTPPDSPYRVLRERAMKNHAICPVCGNVCGRRRDKYCSFECFSTTRSSSGKFTKGGGSNGKKEKQSVKNAASQS